MLLLFSNATTCVIPKLFAFERDRKRYITLQAMLSRAHCQNVETVNADFLTVSPADDRYRAVTHM